MKISLNRIFFMPLNPYSQLYFIVKIIKAFSVCIDYNDSQALWTKTQEAIVKNNTALQC